MVPEHTQASLHSSRVVVDITNSFFTNAQVMHPKNPFAPTVHFNYRYFETDAPEGTHFKISIVSESVK